MLAQRRRSWQRGRQLVCRRGDRMAASTLGSRASHTPSARIARSPRARRRCRHFIVLDTDRHAKDRWRCVAPRVPGLARRRPCPRGRGRASGLPQLSCAPRGGSLPAGAGCAERRRAEPVWLTHTERDTALMPAPGGPSWALVARLAAGRRHRLRIRGFFATGIFEPRWTVARKVATGAREGACNSSRSPPFSPDALTPQALDRGGWRAV